MDLKKLMEKKKEDQGPIDPTYKDAKMSMLQALLHEMHGMMGQDLHGLKKVEVAAPDKPSLADGLDKAKEMLGNASAGDESGDEDGDADHEEGIADHDESPAFEGQHSMGQEGHDPYAAMGHDELQQHLAMLHSKLGKR
jgi:hypothetical protein